jgi:hypothetical protein
LVLGVYCLNQGQMFGSLNSAAPAEQAALTRRLERVVVTSWQTGGNGEGLAALEGYE